MVIILRRHFRDLTRKFSLYPITKQKVANFENTVTHLYLVYSSRYGFYHQSDIWEVLRLKSHETSFQAKRWPIWKMLLHDSEWSFSRSRWVLIITTIFWSFDDETITQPFTTQNMANLQNGARSF